MHASLAALLALALVVPAAAQIDGPLQQDARPLVPSVAVLGMGGIAAAVPVEGSAFFYNPAHLARLDLGRVRVGIAGTQGAVSSDVAEKIAFFRDELQPAIEEGLEEMNRTDPDRLVELYERAFEVGRRQSMAEAAALGPSVQVGVGRGGVGAGLFVDGRSRLQYADAGIGVPRLDFFSQLDVVVPVAAAIRIPTTPLAVGATATWTHRRVAAKSGLVEELDPETENLYVLSATGVAVDVGLHARDAAVPGLDLGLTVHHLLSSPMDYRQTGRFEVLGGDDNPDDEAEIAELEARFNSRAVPRTVRVGAAYRVPLPPGAGRLLRDVALAADYEGGSTSDFEQPFLAHLRFGAQAKVGPVFAVRAGLAQGYPSLGAGLALPGVRLDYAWFGVEDGCTAGQLGRRNHVLRLQFGLF